MERGSTLETGLKSWEYSRVGSNPTLGTNLQFFGDTALCINLTSATVTLSSLLVEPLDEGQMTDTLTNSPYARSEALPASRRILWNIPAGRSGTGTDVENSCGTAPRQR
jgi:hypothetical protein